MHVSTLQLGEGIYQGERKLYLHLVCSLLISEGTQKVFRRQNFVILFADFAPFFSSKHFSLQFPDSAQKTFKYKYIKAWPSELNEKGF